MAAPLTAAFGDIIALVKTHCRNVALLRRESLPDIAILELTADYGNYRLHLREIQRADGSQKYAYYVLHESTVLVGFDNAADPRALSLKYGSAYGQHRLELIPHQHLQGKHDLVLTAEMDCAAVFAWLQEHLLA